MNFKHCLFLLVCLSMTVFHSCKDNTDDRDDFIGTFATVEDCTGSIDNYTITLTAGTENDEVSLFNLYDISVSITGVVDGNSISFNETVMDSGYTGVFTGTGTLTDNILNLSFTLVSDGYTETCTAVATRN